MRLSIVPRAVTIVLSMLLFSSVVAGAPASRDADDQRSTHDHSLLVSFYFMLCSTRELPPKVAVTTYLHVDTEVVSIHLDDALVGQAFVTSFASLLKAALEARPEFNNIGDGKTILVDQYDGVWNDEHFTRYRYVFRTEYGRDLENKLASIDLYVEADISEDGRLYLVDLFSSLEQCSGGSGTFYTGAAPVLLAPLQPTPPNSTTDKDPT